MYRRILFFILVISLAAIQKGAAQVSISGTSCVLSGGTHQYTYNISGTWSPSDIPTFQWCVNGGTIVGSGGCKSATSNIQVIWDNGITSGDISLQTGVGNATKTITIANTASTGVVSPATQSVNYGSTSVAVTCTATFPGIGCIAFTYQWEVASAPEGTYTDVSGATSQDLSIASVTVPGYYRRKTVITSNAEVFYSTVAEVLIPPLNPGTITLNTAPSYHAGASITAPAATGGNCLSANYQYSWEESVEGGPWVVIGTSAAYPTGAPEITGSTLIRRKITCGSESLYSNTLLVKPAYTSVDNENRNYVRTFTVATMGIQSWYQADQLPVGQKFQQTTYYDGLGRSIQEVNKAVSVTSGDTWQDMVAFTEYNSLGRPTFNYLPYPTNNQPGKFKTSNSAQATFYSTNYNESSPWGKTEYEDNPLGRITKNIDPGNYRLANSVGVSAEYDFNNSNSINEKVHIWQIGYTSGALPSTSTTDVYPVGTLAKALTIDDKGKKVIEYKDLNGNTILKKVQLKETGSGLTNEHDGWLCTYYVYDDFNRLRYVITPKAVAYLDANSWTLTQAIADDLCFYYEYDEKGRVTIKKSPGAVKLSMVYDLRDRVVFTQDGNQFNKTTKEWLVSFYDDRDRVVLTGIYKTSKTRGQLQDDLNSATTTVTLTIPGEHIERLIVDRRETVSPPERYAATNYVELVSEFTSNASDEFEVEIDPDIVASSQNVTVILNAVPQVDISDPAKFTALTYHYYDNYNYTGAKPFDNTFNNLDAYYDSTLDVKTIAKTDRTLSMPTGSKIRVLGSDIFLISSVYYDEDGGVIQTSGDNYKGGVDIATNQYHFDGRIMSTYEKHSVPGGLFNGFGILTKNVYDNIGQLITLQKKYGTADFKTIANYEYDEFGRLKTKKLGKKPNTTDDPLETLNYSYNANGLLTGINKEYALSGTNTDQWNNYFGLYIGYENFDSKFTTARYDHLITGLIWKTQGDNTPRKYDFTYDNAGRYTTANFTQKSAPADATWTNVKADFSESNILYDENGNLKQLYRKGIIAGTASPLYIDKLNYTYKGTGEWSNQLLKVFDNAPDIGSTANGKLGDFKDEVYNSNTDDYTYDFNGNLVKDNNKKIRNGSADGIIYNFLDKPERIVIENKSTVEYIYDAAGIKLAKKVTPVSGTAKTTYYLGEFVYEDDNLQYILHEEGRLRIMEPVSSTSPLGAGAQIINGNIQLTSTKWGVFEYFIKDHLGSVRMVLTEEYHKEIYTCTMEQAAASEEEQLFGKVDNSGAPLSDNEVVKTRTNNVGWSSNTSNKVSKLFATSTLTDKSIGPNVLLKVMAGDFINARSDYFYDVPGTVNNSNILNPLVSSIIGGFAGSGVSQPIKDGATSLQTTLQDPMGPIAGFLGGRPSQVSNKPKAYLNYVFFDENFDFVQDGSGALVVNPNDNDDALTVQNLKAPKNGYVYVYLSNESDWPVLFDNFIVTHERGAIIEESHYYPTGLKIAGISSRAFNKPSNIYGYQGSFSEEEVETGYDEFDLRMYDPQIGRWIQADPYDQFASGYVGMGNDPVNGIDPSGGIRIDFGDLGQITGSILGDRLLISGVGALIGFGIDKLTGGKGVWGSIIGAGVALGATFIPQFDIGGLKFGDNDGSGNGKPGFFGKIGKSFHDFMKDLYNDYVTADKTFIIWTALTDARQLLYNRITDLSLWSEATRNDFKTIFGRDDEFARQLILKRSYNILGVIDSWLLGNAYEKQFFDGNDPYYDAHVYGRDPDLEIYLDPNFWTRPATGQYSKATIIIHELSHFSKISATVLGTRDFNLYGLKNVKKLAVSDPNRALLHAAAYMYFIAGGPY